MGLNDPIANVKALREQFRQAGAYGAAERAREAALNPPAAEYAGFDARSGEAILKLPNGELVRGQPIFNSLIQPGDRVILDPATGRPFADQVSVSPQPEPVEPEPVEVFGKLKILFYTPDGGLWIGGDRSTPRQIGQWDESTRDHRLTNKGSGEIVCWVRLVSDEESKLQWLKGREQSFWETDLSVFADGVVYLGAGAWFVGLTTGLIGWNNFRPVGPGEPERPPDVFVSYSVSGEYEMYLLTPNQTYTATRSASASCTGYLRPPNYIIGSHTKSESGSTFVGPARQKDLILSYSNVFSDNAFEPLTGSFSSSSAGANCAAIGVTGDYIWSEFTSTNSFTEPDGGSSSSSTLTYRYTSGGSDHTISPPNGVPFGAKGANFVRGVMYSVTDIVRSAKTAKLKTFASPDWGTKEETISFLPIPTDATILDWSYHP